MIDEGTAEEAKSILETVVSSGTGTNAQIGAEGQWGKTGTTENNGDAWFCGGVGDEVTACVWVGYADSTTPMTTLYNGGPVMGGTFPALIWASVISAWEEIKAEHAAEKAAKKAGHEASEGGSGEAESYVPPNRIDRSGARKPKKSKRRRKSKPRPKPKRRRKRPRSRAGSRARIRRRRWRRHRGLAPAVGVSPAAATAAAARRRGCRRR